MTAPFVPEKPQSCIPPSSFGRWGTSTVAISASAARLSAAQSAISFSQCLELDFTFPPLWTPKATEIADIADKKASAVITAYQAGILPDKSSAMKELKNLEDETGMFGSISDDDVDAAKGITQNMSDPLAGVM